jgi:DNA-binding phage protein
MKYRTLSEYTIERLKDPVFAQEYINAALEAYTEDFNNDALANAIKNLVLASGSISNFSKITGINRQHLYTIFNNRTKPQIDTFSKILKAFGFGIKVEKLAS